MFMVNVEDTTSFGRLSADRALTTLTFQDGVVLFKGEPVNFFDPDTSTFQFLTLARTVFLLSSSE
jgi:hypothetical protein